MGVFAKPFLATILGHHDKFQLAWLPLHTDTRTLTLASHSKALFVSNTRTCLHNTFWPDISNSTHAERRRCCSSHALNCTKAEETPHQASIHMAHELGSPCPGRHAPSPAHPIGLACLWTSLKVWIMPPKRSAKHSPSGDLLS